MSTRAGVMAAIIDTLDAHASLTHWPGPPSLDAFPDTLAGRGFYVVPTDEDLGAPTGLGRFGSVYYEVSIPTRTTGRHEAGTEAALSLAAAASAALAAAEPLDGARVDVLAVEPEILDDGHRIVTHLRVEARGWFTA